MKYLFLFFFIFMYLSGCSENTVNTNEDIIPPDIISIFPPDSSENINLETPVFAVFSEKIDPASATRSNIKFTTSGREQNYSIVMKSDTLLIKPDTLLKYSTKYRVSITTGVKDQAGNPLKEPKMWHFVTATDPDIIESDTTPPEITATDPANGATGVSNSAVITVTFSEPVLNVNASTFTVKADGNPVNGNVTLNGLSAVFDPTDLFPYSANVTANFSSAITDTAGNTLTEYSFSFTVEDDPSIDTTPPEVVATDPADGAVDVPADSRIYVTFSEPVFRVGGSFVHVYANGELFDGSWFHHDGDSTAYFLPQTNSFPYSAAIEVVFTSGVLDSAGNALIEYHLNFTIQNNTPWTLPDYRYSIYTLDLDNSGNVFFGGYFESMPFVGKFLSNGELSWLNNINSTDDNGVASVEYYNGYMYVLRYRYYGSSLWDNTIEKVNPSDGTVVWSYNLDITSDKAVDMYIKDGYIFMALVQHLVRVDAESGLNKISIYVPNAVSSVYAYDNSIYVAENYSSPGRGTEIKIEAYSYALNLLWSHDYGTVNYDGSAHLSANSNGIYVVISADGVLNSRPFKMGLLKYDFNGTLLNDSLYSSIVADGELSSGITIDENGDIYTIYGPVKFGLAGEIIWDDFNSVHLYGSDIKYTDGKIFSANSSDHINIFDSGTGAQIFP